MFDKIFGEILYIMRYKKIYYFEICSIINLAKYLIEYFI